MIVPDYWVLLTLRNASEEFGFDIDTWFNFYKPTEFTIKKPEFTILIDKLEKEGFLKRASKEPTNFYLSEIGKSKISNLKHELEFDEYYNIISKFPEIELKERVSTMETLILSIFGIFLISTFIKFPYKEYIGNSSLILIITILLLIFLLITTYKTGSILGTLIVLKIIQNKNYWKYKGWLWSNQDNIKKGISCILILLIVVILDYLQLYNYVDSAVGIIISIIGAWLYTSFISKTN